MFVFVLVCMLLCFYCLTDILLLWLFLMVPWLVCSVLLWYCLIILTFCVPCEEWLTQRDHDFVGVSVGGVGVTLLVSDQLQLKGSIKFIQIYKRVEHHQIQFKFEKGGHPQNFG